MRSDRPVPLALTLPRRLTPSAESWHAYIPFAFQVVALLRPRVVVELGSAPSDSYAALCQAVDALGLEARCSAVVEPACPARGNPGAEGVRDLGAYHDPRYERFSTVLETRVDEAVGRFAPSTIDLLHIRALGPEETVRGVLEAWLPKLSARAVVLLHGIDVRPDGRPGALWRELGEQFPTFALTHGDGLGMVVVGKHAPRELHAMCAVSVDERARTALVYAALGERVTRPSASVRAAAALRAVQVSTSRLAARAWREPMRDVRRRAREAWDAWKIRRSGLFDARWYAKTYPAAAATGMDPLTHFIREGAAAGLDPNPWFDTSWYVERNKRATARGRNPLVHYLKHPDRDPHPDFHTSRYLAANPDAPRSNPLLHFLTGGARDADDELLEARRIFATGVMNGAWYGATPIERSPDPAVAPISEVIAGRIERVDTRAVERYVDPMRGLGAGRPVAPLFLASSLAPLAESERRLTAARPSAPAVEGLSFTVLTPFYRHGEHFAECGRSVAELASRSEGTAIEWVVVNDDPAFTAADLERSVPPSLRAFTRILSDGQRRGIVERLNQGVAAARHAWILFLDCDDLVAFDAIATLRRYIARFPRCRYVSSAMIDIDEEGELLRYRRRTAAPVFLLRDGMTAGHLKAIRRDAFDDRGPFLREFEGCQDYEFALRMAFEEPLLYVPEYLYSYRWHCHSQSVARATQQARTAEAIVRRYAMSRLLAVDPEEPGPERAAGSLSAAGVAVVRTQGLRNDLLAETLHSLRFQASPLAALVVVHGGTEALASVRRVIAGAPGVELLHAPDVGRHPAHALNVALRRLYESPDSAAFVCFLDDHDILYPLFSSVMHEALLATGADVVYSATNKRVASKPAETGHAPLPASCLLVRNFIPLHAYAARLEALRRERLFFDEGLACHEEWEFLVRALGAGIRFHPLDDVLSESRTTGDGQLRPKVRRKVSDECLARVRRRAASAAESLGRRRLLVEMLRFPPHMLERLQPEARELVLSARAYIDEQCPVPVDAAREVAS